MPAASSAIPVALILTSAVLHATVGATQKSADDPFAARFLGGITAALLALPMLFFVQLPSGTTWLWLLATIPAHVAYQVGMSNAYRYGAFSIVYPVARGTAPLLTATGAALLFSEPVGRTVIAGVALISIGILSLAISGHRNRHADPGTRIGTMFAVATGGTIAAYTLVDAAGVRSAPDPLTYVAWFFQVDGLIGLTLGLLRGRVSGKPSRRDLRLGIVGGAMAMAGYALALLSLRAGATAEIAALRETSTIVGALIGALWFQESFGWRRVLAASLVACGAVLVAL